MIRWHNDATPQAPRWRAEVNGQTIAYAAKTGTHLDDYPWDWYIEHDVRVLYDWPDRTRTGGTVDTLRTAKDDLAHAWAARILKR